MSLKGSVRALPSMMRVSFAESMAYRFEMLVWVLATTMPLIMLALWTAVARDEPIISRTGRQFGQSEFIAYFLSTFIVRQLNASWASWEINYEVRTGTLSSRLLRPVSPLLAYAVENIAALPLRIVVAIPVAIISLLAVGASMLPADPIIWIIWAIAMAGGWIITFLANVAIGCLSLFMQSSVKVMDIWLAAFFVFSGYLFPIELLPVWLQRLANFLPFRYQLGFSVELMNSYYGRTDALSLLWRQWLCIAVLSAAVALLWKRGLRRFAAYGG